MNVNESCTEHSTYGKSNTSVSQKSWVRRQQRVEEEFVLLLFSRPAFLPKWHHILIPWKWKTLVTGGNVRFWSGEVRLGGCCETRLLTKVTAFHHWTWDGEHVLSTFFGWMGHRKYWYIHLLNHASVQLSLPLSHLDIYHFLSICLSRELFIENLDLLWYCRELIVRRI